MRLTPPPATVEDYRLLARRRLPHFLFDYIDAGAYAERTTARNRAAMGEVRLRQRVLRDMSKIDLGAELFGQALSMPVLLGPVGLAGMFARRGEAQAARAASAAGVPFCLSTVSICDIAETTRAAGAPIWFQLYMVRDRGFIRDLLAEARRNGCKVLILTVDVPTPGLRPRDARSGMYGGLSPIGTAAHTLRVASHLHWMWNVYARGRPHLFGNIAPTMPEAKSLADFWSWVGKNLDPSLCWGDIAWLREQWDGPIVIKGILDPEDALEAVRVGADGVVVSNHGGRQLDDVAATIEALPRIVEAVGDRVTVLMDGGVRSGLDVLKALAYGAKACLLGRAWAFAVAGAGQPGVEKALGFIRRELQAAMIMTGCADVRAAGRDLIDHHRAS